jgi:hypothetical protein
LKPDIKRTLIEVLRVNENREMRIFGLRGRKCQKSEKMHNEKIHNLYSSPYISKVVISRSVR